MRTLVIGDVHGCADELAALVRVVRPDRTVLVGDLFAKGPDPVGVWEQVRDATVVLGNHEVRLLEAVRHPADREARRCIERLDDGAPGWRAWVEALPLFAEVAGWTVVHAGLHPSGRLEHTTRRMALNLRRYPDERPESPFWWQAYTGARRVVFGHDARRGLVRVERAGQPWCIGLDTGCVYGGRLSGYVLEEDRLFQVPARRVYKPVG